MEALKTYKETCFLRTCDCDFQGTWRPSAILTAMQEAAGMHSEKLGCGRNALLKNRIVWVLSRCEVRMMEYPQIGDTVTVETAPVANRRWFFPRYYWFRNEEGREIGCASTLWVLLNMDDRRMVPPGEVAGTIPDNRHLILPMGLPGTVEPVDGEEVILPRAPYYFDLDVNQHVNNTRYADWACDALGIDVMREYCLETMLINYAAEVRPDQEMTLHVHRNGPAYQVAGYHDGKMHFELGGTLRARSK
ncbi:MAG: hypothetical protein IJ189_01140 [Clostridia bacterium]|nr:hypothetical protein [Clostridia bacterium]